MTVHKIKFDPQKFVGEYAVLEKDASPGTTDPISGETLWSKYKSNGTSERDLQAGDYSLHVDGAVGGTHFSFSVDANGNVPEDSIANPHSSSMPAMSNNSATLTLENVNVWIDPSRFAGKFKSNLTRNIEHDGSSGKIGPLVAIPGVLFTVWNQSDGGQFDPPIVGSYLHYQGDDADVRLESAAKGIKDGIRLKTASVRFQPESGYWFDVPGYGKLNQDSFVELICGLHLSVSLSNSSGSSVMKFTPTTGRR